MKTLSLNVAIIYSANLFTGNLLELLLPYLSYRYKYKKESEASKDEMSVPEREYLLDKVHLFPRFRSLLAPVSLLYYLHSLLYIQILIFALLYVLSHIHAPLSCVPVYSHLYDITVRRDVSQPSRLRRSSNQLRISGLIRISTAHGCLLRTHRGLLGNPL
jgi:hypothetical protein